MSDRRPRGTIRYAGMTVPGEITAIDMIVPESPQMRAFSAYMRTAYGRALDQLVIYRDPPVWPNPWLQPDYRWPDLSDVPEALGGRRHDRHVHVNPLAILLAQPDRYDGPSWQLTIPPRRPRWDVLGPAATMIRRLLWLNIVQQQIGMRRGASATWVVRPGAVWVGGRTPAWIKPAIEQIVEHATRRRAQHNPVADRWATRLGGRTLTDLDHWYGTVRTIDANV
ncbi:hypothetical protein SEA_VERITY_67 [Gordonia phage Verity]|uniref:Uncharacterized protein n=2 Tax=Zitchvirus TaxID=2948963 RepID=A0A514DIW2_9CAUD|nr:hypothetical protein J1775_gp69 [Gordonia phage Zipp]YP_010002905.1 hypothetical protein J1776_gp67 [Gordonia phage Verity]QPO16910.1 hypothetical protein SEA_DELREY21_67 [Gordonia phage Delrey21]QXN74193.1 hypothetical protein SEA_DOCTORFROGGO_67 [Gordonia phage DoctorFroggo]QDH93222.1 hypothetical protein SEA_ZIPP_69 [Gordonia phage Zipp]QDH93553.1 hypothetical protein SEA_VERITY_67 [Gordonia phage Verity]